MNTSTAPRAPRFNIWPVSIISFYTIAILGCVTFVTFCSRHPADLISQNYYEEEVKYQGQIDRLQHTQERAPLSSVAYDQAGKRIAVSVSAELAQSKPVGQIQLYRPSASNLDRTLKLDVDSTGLQWVDAASLLPGLWKVRVSWTVNNREFFIDQKVIIPSAAL